MPQGLELTIITTWRESDWSRTSCDYKINRTFTEVLASLGLSQVRRLTLICHIY